MAYREVATRTIPLTVEVAKQFDRMNTLAGERDPDSPQGRARVGWLHSILSQGAFHSPVWSTCIVKNEHKRKYRVDGGHSSRMLTQANGTFPEDMMVTIREFEADTITDAVDLYEQFNQRGSTRTTSDLVRNKAAYVDGLAGIKPVYINKGIQGIRLHLKLQEGFSGPDALDFIRLYPDFLVWAVEYAKNRQLSRVGVMAAMFATWGKNVALCKEFWGHVRDEDLTKDDPTRTFANWLDQAEKDALRSRATEWTSRAYYVKAHHAWNAWRRGETTSLRYHESAPLPELAS